MFIFDTVFNVGVIFINNFTVLDQMVPRFLIFRIGHHYLRAGHVDEAAVPVFEHTFL